MKRTKGIGPNNLGVSKSAVKNQNKGYAGDFGIAKQVADDNAEVKKKEQPDASGKKPPKDPKQTMAGSMAPKSNYGSMAESNKFVGELNKAREAGASTFEVGGKTYDVKPKSSGITQTRAEIKANKLALKAEQAVKDDNMNKNEKLVGRHNDYIKRKGLNKKPLAYG